ncbi:MAG: TadE/TadG family type IV pilus assembly protein [Candidatus Dormibacteria bacterium]
MTLASGQRGQVVPIFAIMAVVIVGIIALAIDYGVLVNQHRNLQYYADSAALAGAEQIGSVSPSTVDRTNARTAAFIYLRDGLQFPAITVNVAFMNGNTACNLTANVVDCKLPPPYDNYVISIASPSETYPAPIPPAAYTAQLSDTVSVKVVETVANSFAGLIGVAQSTASAIGVGRWTQARHAGFALYADSCINFGNHTEVVGGNVYSDKCTVQAQSNGQGGFCAEASPGGNGNLTVGPGNGATLPPNSSGGQTLAVCSTASGGNVDAMGVVAHSSVSQPSPAFAPPPNPPPAPCTTNCPIAAHSYTCVNGSHAASGIAASNCYDPSGGPYSTIGVGDGGIRNNLNPGVYYVTGDLASSCYTNSTTNACPAVVFGGNTMNANFADVQDTCWAAPNAPQNGTFVSPCPDGFAFDPTIPTDPQCGGTATTPPPSPSATVSAGVGTLAAGTYYVRVTSINAQGESLPSPELSQAVPPLGGVSVAISPVAGATGYVIYMSNATGAEVADVPLGTVPSANNWTVAAALTPIAHLEAALPTGQTPYPHFANACAAQGFANIPRNRYENNGVTFVLSGKASICTDSNCSAVGSATPTVLLSPYCSVLSNADLPPPGPYASCPYSTFGPNINDGAFTVYGSSSPTAQGNIQATGSGTQLGLTGTIYGPKMTLSVTGNAQFELIPGQAILFSMAVQTGNKLNPAIYDNNAVGGLLPASVRLVQ